jgi:hypothetical protein
MITPFLRSPRLPWLALTYTVYKSNMIEPIIMVHGGLMILLLYYNISPIYTSIDGILLYIELICAFFIISALNYTVSKAHLALKYTKNIGGIYKPSHTIISCSYNSVKYSLMKPIHEQYIWSVCSPR